MPELVDEVIALRKARQPASTEEQQGQREVRRGVGRARDGYLKAAQKRSGWASHGISGGLVATITYRLIKRSRLKRADRDPIREVCVEAAFDGYALASVVTEVRPGGQGRVFKRPADSSRFAGRVIGSGRALLAGPLGADAARLVDGWVETLEERLRPVGRRIVANALAAGILAFAYEHEVDHPRFAGLAGKARRARKPAARKPAARKPARS